MSMQQNRLAIFISASVLFTGSCLFVQSKSDHSAAGASGARDIAELHELLVCRV